MDFAISRKRIDDAERFSCTYLTRGFPGFHFSCHSLDKSAKRDRIDPAWLDQALLLLAVLLMLFECV